jgi:hypothetical protein
VYLIQAIEIVILKYGTSVGSSVNSTTNNFVEFRENIRSGKLEFLQDFSPVA